MFSNRPKPPRPDQKWELDKKLEELKRRYDILLTHWANAPEPPEMGTLDAQKFRTYYFDNRVFLDRSRTLLSIVQESIRDAQEAWPEGRPAFYLLMTSADLMRRLTDNLQEENALWEREDPLDSYSQSRRARIFSDNRKLGGESDEKFLAGCELLCELTGWNIYSPDQQQDPEA